MTFCLIEMQDDRHRECMELGSASRDPDSARAVAAGKFHQFERTHWRASVPRAFPELW